MTAILCRGRSKFLNVTSILLFFSLYLFADEHCIKLVELGIVGPLLKLIRKEENAEDDYVDMRLGHAVLSALRNLAISSKCKQTIEMF